MLINFLAEEGLTVQKENLILDINQLDEDELIRVRDMFYRYNHMKEVQICNIRLGFIHGVLSEQESKVLIRKYKKEAKHA